MRNTTIFTLAVLVGVSNAVVASQPGPSSTFPSALRGVWDMYPHPCVANEVSDSDMRFAIDQRVRSNHEHKDVLKSIEQLATSPPTWRVTTTSDLGPSDNKPQASIYVLKGKYLAVTDGERAETYIRCK